MHIDTIPNRNSRPAYLLSESVRDGAKVRKRTLANLSSLPIEQIEMIRRVLKGERLDPVEDGLGCIAFKHHGHVEAVNVGDPKTLLAQVEKARRDFSLDRLVMVGDRGPDERPCS